MAESAQQLKRDEPAPAAEKGGTHRFVTGADVLRLAPTLCWVAFAVWLVIRFQDPIMNKLLPGLNSVEAFGFKIGFGDAKRELQKAVEKQQPNGAGTSRPAVSDTEVSQVVQRARFLAPVLQGARILWVDPKPVSNVYECNFLRSFGIFVDLAESTRTAIDLAAVSPYDAVISNMTRPDEPPGPVEDGKPLPAGLVLLRQLQEKGSTAPFLIYLMNFDPSRGTPAGAFAITNRPDHLLHSVMDALERRRSFPGLGATTAPVK